MSRLPNDEAYSVSAPFYDLHAPRNVDQVLGFWSEVVVRQAGRPIVDVLEFGVGTGRIAIPLAAAGCRLTGTDGNQAMLDICRQKAAAAGVDIALRREWMQDFHEVECYDALVAVFWAPAFLVTDDSIRRFLIACHAALRPGGILLADVANSPAGLTSPWAGTTLSEHQQGNRRMKRLLQMTPDTLRGTVQYRELAMIWDDANPLPSGYYEDEFVLRMFSLAEFRLLLEPAGFRQAAWYGDWSHRAPLEQPAPRLILVATK